MKKLQEVRPLFFQYLILFFTAAFLPVVITCAALLISNNTLHEEIIRANQASVTLIQQSLDSKITELQDMLYQIDQDPSLTRYALDNFPRSAITTLNSYTQHHDSMSNVMIYVHDTAYFYTASGTFSLSDLKHQSFIKDLVSRHYSAGDWLDVLCATSSPTYWPVNTVGQMPTYLYLFSPVYSNFQYKNNDSSRTIVLMIKQEFIQSLFRSSQTSMGESVLLFNSQMDLISQLAPDITNQTIQDICTFLKNTELSDGSAYFEFTAENIMLFVSKSPRTGLYYVRFLPKKIALHSIYTIRSYSAVILSVVVLIGLILISIGIRKSYAPIRSLADQIRTVYPQNQDIKNELLLFQQTLDDSFERNLALSQTLARSKYGLIDHLISTLIQGNFPSYDDFQSACQELSIHLDKKYYAVCTILFESVSPPGSLKFDRILKIITQEVPDSLQIQVKDLLFANRVILVLSSDTDNGDFYCTVMRAIQNRLLETADLSASFALGSFYDSFDDVGKSYLDSTNALDYRMVYGKKCFIAPHSYNNVFEREQYPSDQLDSLYFALLSQNKGKVVEIAHKLADYTKSSNCSLHMAKYICYDAFSVLKKALHSTAAIYSVPSKMMSITDLTSFGTIDEFFISFIDVVQTSIKDSEDSDEKSALSKTDLAQQIIDYIDTHCFSYSFQIDNVANVFSITPQYMRRLFKERTGRTISEYVANLKLEKAMQLLQETDKSLQEIVLDIGNTDVSGFIRLFKQRTGMTPGQYRKGVEKSTQPNDSLR